jgi:ABC-type transport system involved in multi-copper enzyme maturation permease subunit
MFWRLLSIEHTKIFRRWTLRIELGLFLCLLTLGYIVELVTILQAQARGVPVSGMEGSITTVTWPFVLFNAMEGIGIFGVLFTIILVGTMTAQEYSWRTMSLWVGRGAQRFQLAAAKFVSFLLPILCIVILPVIYGGALSIPATIHFRGSFDPSHVDYFRLTQALIGMSYSLLPIAAITFFLAMLTRSTAAVIGIGLGYFLIAENLIGAILTSSGGNAEKIARYLPGVLVLRVSSVFQNGAIPSPLTSEFLLNLAGVALYTLVFFLLAAGLFHRQDLGG